MADTKMSGLTAITSIATPSDTIMHVVIDAGSVPKNRNINLANFAANYIASQTYTWTQPHVFSNSLQIPTGAPPTLDALGEVGFDTAGVDSAIALGAMSIRGNSNTNIHVIAVQHDQWPPLNGETIAYNSSAGGFWEFTASVGGANALNDLTDVTISGPVADNEVLQYNAGTSQWVNRTLTAAGIGGLSIVNTWESANEFNGKIKVPDSTLSDLQANHVTDAGEIGFISGETTITGTSYPDGALLVHGDNVGANTEQVVLGVRVEDFNPSEGEVLAYTSGGGSDGHLVFIPPSSGGQANVRTVTLATDTLQVGDVNNIVRVTAACDVTIPSGLTVTVGAIINITYDINGGTTNQVKIIAGSGVTLNDQAATAEATIINNYDSVSLLQVAPDEWVMSGPHSGVAIP